MEMQHVKKVLALLLLVLVLGAICVLPEGFAQDCRVVRLHGGYHGWEDRVEIEPQTTWITKGSCVVWMNWIQSTKKVKVIFAEGKRCDDLTESPVGFKMEANNCYVTSWIPLGGTSSLLFKNEGTFDYVVEVEEGTRTQGKIIVRPAE